MARTARARGRYAGGQSTDNKDVGGRASKSKGDTNKGGNGSR